MQYHCMNIHEPSGEKSEDSKDSFCEGLDKVFNNFPKCHMKILV